ncbi:ATP-grasp domain-containing protein [Hamadaea tsunoensis]|uniref:ATP-grasp domain-containing protein n=1 Tax=Hamadaea tsunoensis TaxID=53368 RepID=UPI000421B266|nr:ATP-grasp domain-containing protein [Hamadaea tsunoensis]
MSTDEIVLLLGSGGQPYREYLLSAAADTAAVWLLEGAEPTWQARYVRGASVVPLLDRARLIPDREQLIKTADELAATHKVIGAFSWDETLVVTAAHITDRLGLPGLTLDGVENCRNKHNTRQVLTAAGLVQPRFAYVTSVEEAASKAAEFGYPVVLKPRGMGASIGVIRADGPDDVAHAFAVAEAGSYGGSPSYEGGVLVEEFLTGPEISVDGAVVGGAYTPMFLAHKQIGLEPYFEEVGHVVDAADPLLSDEALLATLRTAHEALGVKDGITHTEVKLTPRGPAIVEVNARLGGDLIPYLGKRATGIDPGRAAVAIATGRTPELAATKTTAVGIRFCYPPANGTVRAIHVPAEGTLPGLVETRAIVADGAVLRLPPDGYITRYAYLIAEAATPAEVTAILDEAAALVSIDLDGIPGD